MTTSGFVIRSMTTTDFDWRNGTPVKPYHIYLRPPEKRKSAYWTAFKDEAQVFPSAEAAAAEKARCLPGDHGAEITPFDDAGLPTYWENQKARLTK